MYGQFPEANGNEWKVMTIPHMLKSGLKLFSLVFVKNSRAMFQKQYNFFYLNKVIIKPVVI